MFFPAKGKATRRSSQVMVVTEAWTTTATPASALDGSNRVDGDGDDGGSDGFGFDFGGDGDGAAARDDAVHITSSDSSDDDDDADGGGSGDMRSTLISACNDDNDAEVAVQKVQAAKRHLASQKRKSVVAVEEMQVGTSRCVLTVWRCR